MKNLQDYRWVIALLPFILVPVIAGLILTGIFFDRKIDAAYGDAMARKTETEERTPLKYDVSLKTVLSKFMMLPRDEASFEYHVSWKGATPQGLSPWLGRFNDGLTTMTTLFPPDPEVLREETVKGDGQLMNLKPSLELVEKIFNRILTLVKLSGRLGRDDWDDRFFSLIHMATVIQRGTGGRVNQRDIAGGAKLLARCYGELFPLVRDGKMKPEKVPVFIKRMDGFTALLISDARLYEYQKDEALSILQSLKNKWGFRWKLPSLACISDPSYTLENFTKEICGATALPGCTAVEEIGNIAKRYRDDFFSPVIVSTRFASKPRIEEVIQLNSGLKKGQSVTEAFKLMILIIDYTLVNNRFPERLSDIDYYKEKPVFDPLTGRPFHYRRKGPGFTLYSEGLDGIDNGGAPGLDVVFTG